VQLRTDLRRRARDPRNCEAVDTNDEIRAMLAAIQGTELEDLVPLIFHTATRSHETRAMRGSQVDLERAIWRIPPHLAKTGEVVQQEHDVPLSKGPVAILKRIQKRQRRVLLSP
jgi:integrase